MPLRIVMANRLGDGAAVCLARDGGWSERIDDSLHAANDAEAAVLLAATEWFVVNRTIAAPHLIEIAENDAGIRPQEPEPADRARAGVLPRHGTGSSVCAAYWAY